MNKKIKKALISVFHKDGLDEIITLLKQNNVEIYSTGGTQQYIETLGAKVSPVEQLTTYPSILGGRVKTLHPKVFGGILARQSHQNDVVELENYEIPSFDLVVVDLYPFEETVETTQDHGQIIEKIDIGGISLIRAAAKNYNDVCIIPSKNQYAILKDILENQKGETSNKIRLQLAKQAFEISSTYDAAIQEYFSTKTEAEETPEATQNQNSLPEKVSITLRNKKSLRYGENPHQEGAFYGNLHELFTQLNGKELSFNNLLDVDAALSLLSDLDDHAPTVVIIKHTNACGIAKRETLLQAWNDAVAGDPVSAFGGIIALNKEVDEATAEEMNTLFFEILIAPSFKEEALTILKSKKNRILLQLHEIPQQTYNLRGLLNGILLQQRDNKTENKEDLKTVTQLSPSEDEIKDLLFANIIAKHTKSNTIVLAKNQQLIGSGTGQTSRVDALKQAIQKAKSFNLDTEGAVMASDAFFPFPDCVEIAHNSGINAVIQPGGSIRDQESVDYCNNNQMKMVLTGARHFKH